MKKTIVLIIVAMLLSLMCGAGIIKGISDNEMAPLNNVSREQAIVMMWRLYEHFSGYKILMPDETTPEILTELDIITEEDWNRDGNITTLECFKAIERTLGYSTENVGNISDWYRGDTLASMDYLDDKTKALLLRMNSNSILEYSEIPLLKPDADVTEYEALIYIVRMVGDTYGCTESALESVDTDKISLYETAYEKGLISDKDTSHADQPIERSEFYDILSKALFVEYQRGHEAGVDTYRLIDGHRNKAAGDKAEKTEFEKELVQLPVSAVINDDLSIEWTVPEQYSSFISGRMTELTLLGKDGNEKMVSMSSAKADVEPYELIRHLVSDMNRDWTALRCNYVDSGSDVEYYFDIDISKIRIVMDGEEINPEKYIRYKSSWTAKEISLADGEKFEKGCYYILKGYENTYRDPKYNTVAYEVFMAEETSDIFIAPTNRSFGVHNFDEVHIQKLTLAGNAEDGFVLSITPESTKGFVVEESDVGKW